VSGTDPLRARLTALRDDIRSTPMLHQADAVARERWGDALSALVNELLLVEEAALRAAPAGEEAPRCPEHGLELICPTCFDVTLVAREAAPEEP